MKAIRGTYFFDFLGALIRTHNIPMAIYFLINTAIGVMILSGIAALFGVGSVSALIIGCVVFFIMLLVMFSSVGEAMLRRQVGATCIEPAEKQRLETLFGEAIDRAKKVNPNLDDKITLFMAKDDTMNACAIGRRTVVLNSGMLSLSGREIAGIMAHEIGHISNKDTDLRVAIMAGNGVISIWFFLIRLLIMFFSFLVIIFARGGRWIVTMGMLFVLMGRLFGIVLYVSQWIWFSIGMFVINISGRKQEFRADEFAVKCGGGKGLAQFLTAARDEKCADKCQCVLSHFMASHPEICARLEALENMGVGI